ncbi:restriction endonuclease subunit S [Caenispirillum bisanense]|uniref:restriction endonuclease subunit S n=1 Tax=Caenispirillum bisanense TaxID=414052 RepID=UPI001C3F0570|nr:restriction endonuclease subunit S [Caenispirillum bisanense]
MSSDTLLGVFKNEGMVPMRDRVRGSDVSRCKVLPAGAFAYNPMRLNIGSIARWAGDADAIVSPDYVVFQCDERQLSGDFLDYVRQSKDWATYMENAGKGGVRIRIYFKELGQFRFLLPPLPEQRRIAEILSSVDEAIAATQAVIEQTRTVKQGVLKRLLTKGIGHTRFKQTEIGEIPEAWEVVPLQAIASVQTGLAKGSNKPDDPVELPYLRVANVQDGYIDLTEVKSTAVDRSRVARYSLRAGDVLLTEGGDFDKLGRGAVWRAQVEPCLHQNHVFAVRPNQEVLLSDFLAAQTASDHGRRYFLSCAKQTTNLASINSTQLKEFPAIVPPLKEQSAINARTAALQEAEDVAKASLRRLEQIKSALMSDLLTGRKRVPMAELAAAE